MNSSRDKFAQLARFGRLFPDSFTMFSRHDLAPDSHGPDRLLRFSKLLLNFSPHRTPSTAYLPQKVSMAEVDYQKDRDDSCYDVQTRLGWVVTYLARRHWGVTQAERKPSPAGGVQLSSYFFF